jgi:hemolysin III
MMFHPHRGFFTDRAQTLLEDIANAFTHGVGLILAIAAFVILDVYAGMTGDAYKIVGCTLFGVGLVTMYLASTFYHSLRKHPRAKRFFKTMDHVSIYILIAGSYSPFMLVNLRHDWGWPLFGVIWGLAFLGFIFKVFYIHRFEMLSLAIYIFMGWFIILVIGPLFHHLALAGVLWLLWGGLCYTVGAFFYAWETPLFGHAVWHAFVMGGTICHFFAILFYVIPAVVV